MKSSAQISKKTHYSSVNALSAILRGLVERDYLSQIDGMAWSIRDPEWHDSIADVRIARLVEVSDAASKLSMAPLLAGLGSNGIGPILIVDGTRDGASIYIGTHTAGKSTVSSDEAFSLLQTAIQVNLPGARLEPSLEADSFREQIIRRFDEFRYVSCLTGVPEPSKETTAGLENFVDGMRGEQYLLVVIAQPVASRELDDILRKCRNLSSDIHARVRQTGSKSEQYTTTSGTQTGQSFSGIDMLIAGLISGFTPLHFLGGSGSSAGMSQGETWSESEGVTEGISFERIDKELAYVESFLDEFVDRIEEGKHTGLWNSGVYLLTRNRQVLNLGQSLLRSMLTGSLKKSEPLRSVPLTARIDEVRLVLEQFNVPTIDWADGGHHPLGHLLDQFSTLLTSSEISLLLSVPKRQVVGMNVVPMAQFNLNPPSVERGIVLGKVVHLGQVTGKEAAIEVNDLKRHAFVTGVTGAGKTNTCLTLLQAAARNDIPFLVIEPAKREYRQLVNVEGLGCQVFTLGDESESPLRLNPFQFAPGFPLLTHIDYLKAIFNASFPMYASMPYILEEAILGIYEDWGWDVTTGKNKFVDGPEAMQLLPTLGDLHNRIDVVVSEKRYAERLTMDITAALKARIKSLMVGSKGKMLDVRISNSLNDLFTKPTVLELRRVGNDDEKCFLIALLLVLLYEFCETRQDQPALQHLTLIEEAHRILQNLPPASNEMIGARTQAVNTFSNMLAEIRAYGEGLIIVDQIPAKLSPDVIKNTDLKILHRLVAADDRDSIGRAMTMTSEQIDQVARLRTGEAVVYYEAARTPLLLKMERVSWGNNTAHAKINMPSKVKRSALCERCKVACQFGDLAEPSQDLQKAVQRAVAHLSMSCPDSLQKEWFDLVGQAFLEVKTKTVSRKDWPGMMFCILSKAFKQTFELLFGFYEPLSAGVRLRVLCELDAVDAVQMIIDQGEKSDLISQLKKLSERLKTEIMLKPASAKPGCSICTHPCIFGFWVSQMNEDQIATLRRALIAALRQTKREELQHSTRETVRSIHQGSLEFPDGFTHCVLTRMELSVERLTSLGFHKSQA